MHLTGVGGIFGGIGAAFAGEEFLRGSFDVRAERGAMQSSIATIARSMGEPELAAQVDTMIRNMEGRETPLRYEALMSATSALLTARPESFKNAEEIHKRLKELADISRSPEVFGLATQAYSKVLSEGRLDMQEINASQGYRGAIADVLHVTPEELHEMLKKHTLSSEQQIAAFNAALDKISGPGGVLYKHGESLTQGLMGIHEQFIGHWRDFQESFGKQIENFLQPIADKVFHILTPSTLTHAFKTS